MCGCEYEWNRLLYEEQVEECVEEFWCQWCEEDFSLMGGDLARPGDGFEVE